MDESNNYDKNVDYKAMYLAMVRAAESAMQLLIEAQQRCEELYIDGAAEDEPR